MTAQKLDKQTELNNCTLIKTVLMFIIVLFHSSLFWGEKNWPMNLTVPERHSTFIPLLTYILQSFHTHTFTLISGYLFYYLKFEKGKYNLFLPFVINKTRRLIVPLVAVSFIWVIPATLPVIAGFEQRIVDKFILLKSPNQLWFLLMLFNCFVFFYFFSFFFAQHTRLGFATLLFLALLAFWAPSIFQMRTFFANAIIFGTGFKLRQLDIYIYRKHHFFIAFIVCALLLQSTYYLSNLENRNLCTNLLFIPLQIVQNVVVPTTAFWALQKLTPWIPGKEGKIFHLFSRHSMTVYLFHQQIIYYTILAFNGYLPVSLHISVNFLVSTFVSLLIALVLTHFKIGRFLVGEGK